MNANLLEKILLIVADILGFALAFVFAMWLHFFSGMIPGDIDFWLILKDLEKPFVYLAMGQLILFILTGLYRPWMVRSRTFQIWCVIRTVTVANLFLMVALYAPPVMTSIDNAEPVLVAYAPKVLLAHWLGTIIVVSLFRLLVQLVMRQLLRKGYGSTRILIAGTDASGAKIADDLKKTPELGHVVVGFIRCPNHGEAGDTFHDLPVFGDLKDLEQIIPEQNIDGVVMTHDGSSREEMYEVLKYTAPFKTAVYIIPDLYDIISGSFKTGFVHGTHLKELFPQNMPPWQVPLKRLVDIVVAGILLLITSPVMIFTAVAIRFGSKGPVFYRQERVGQFGKNFTLLKFRSMVVDAEKDGPQWATKSDPRVTGIGKFIRKVRIDELPQLLNVLTGDMSMVGPRPERDHFVEQLKEQIPLYSRRLVMKPGITGWAQVRHHYDTDIEDVKTKLIHDLYYWENMSLMLDFQILVRTVWVVVAARGSQ